MSPPCLIRVISIRGKCGNLSSMMILKGSSLLTCLIAISSGGDGADNRSITIDKACLVPCRTYVTYIAERCSKPDPMKKHQTKVESFCSLSLLKPICQFFSVNNNNCSLFIVVYTGILTMSLYYVVCNVQQQQCGVIVLLQLRAATAVFSFCTVLCVF